MTMTDPQHFDVVVMGGGSGLSAAYHAEADGKSVAVVEARPEALGGTCVNRGCIPTKGLIQSAEVLTTIRRAADFGIHVDLSTLRVDFGAIMDTIRRRRASEAASTKRWVDETFTPYYGRAHFVSDRVLELDDGRRVSGDTIFLATGARPAIPPIPGLDGVGYWTNETVLELDSQPDSLAILGGGYIGCELGHFFATLGTRVTVIDREACLLREDDDVRELFTRQFADAVHLISRTEATRVHDNHGAIELELDGPDGAPRSVTADALLVATGRRPNTDRLSLDTTGVEVDDRGWIRVDRHLRTTAPGIFAFGDVIGQGMFKHTSSTEAELAYRNSQGAALEMSYHANPHAVFSNPQIGSVGLTQRECDERGLRYSVARTDYADIAKGRIIGSPPGFAKVLVEEETDRILGCHVIGPQAADLIHEVVLAMSTEDGRARLVRDTIHTHPTLSELIHTAFAAIG